MTRARLEGSVRVRLPLAEAFALFSPSGERRWASGWDPRFPVMPDDETEPGTVFTTEHHGVITVWMVVSRGPGYAIAYANVSQVGRAALVKVSCSSAPGGGTCASVTYDITALDQDGAAWLEEFAAGYPAYLERWEHAIAAASTGATQ